MKVVTGNPVEGDDFFGRERELAILLERLETDHVLMLAPRRVGKTSMLRQFERTSDKKKFEVIACSFAGCSDELDCIEELLRAIRQNAGMSKKFLAQAKKSIGWIKSIKGPGGFGVELKDDDRSQWREIGDELVQTLSQLAADQAPMPVVCVDELPIFVLSLLKNDKGGERAASFLNWFRNARQANSKSVRWVVAGSIGLDTIVARLNISDTINDFSILPISAFDDATAHGLLERLGESYGIVLHETARQHLIARVGWPIPYYLQLMFSTIKDTLPADQFGVEVEDIDRTFDALLTPAYKAHFDYWHQRLAQELDSPG